MRFSLSLLSTAFLVACSTSPSDPRTVVFHDTAHVLDPIPESSAPGTASRIRPRRAPASTPPQNVLFITIDGVRYHEIFRGVRFPNRASEERGTPVVPQFLKYAEEQGYTFGNKWQDHGRKMKISNTSAISQPGYRALHTGEFESACRNNQCALIDRATFIDRLVDEAKFGSSEVATFASWNVIGKVIESKPGRTVRSIAFEPIQGLSPEQSAPYSEIQARADADRPTKWNGSRYDQYTFEMGLRYLEEFKPRMLYLSFVDSDEHGHNKDYTSYVRSLREWDDRFVKLIEKLRSLGEYGENTSIVVTTDHGRGRGLLFSEHSKEWLDSKNIWAVVIPSETLRRSHEIRRADRPQYRQIDIRPTLEKLLGLPPLDDGKPRGRPLVEF